MHIPDSYKALFHIKHTILIVGLMMGATVLLGAYNGYQNHKDEQQQAMQKLKSIHGFETMPACQAMADVGLPTYHYRPAFEGASEWVCHSVDTAFSNDSKATILYTATGNAYKVTGVSLRFNSRQSALNGKAYQWALQIYASLAVSLHEKLTGRDMVEANLKQIGAGKNFVVDHPDLKIREEFTSIQGANSIGMQYSIQAY